MLLNTNDESGLPYKDQPMGYNIMFKNGFKLLVLSLLLSLTALGKSKAAPVRDVGATAVIVTDNGVLAAPVLHGIGKLKGQLLSKGYKVVIAKTFAGTKGDLFFVAGLAGRKGEAVKQLAALQEKLPEGLEALVVRKTVRQKKPVLVLCGSDANGLMYALLDAARRIGLTDGKDDVLSLIHNTQEKADLADRAISIYAAQRAYFESRFYDGKYWEKYLDQLAQSRINNFVVILNYAKDGFLAPLYPYFFNTDGFPDVRMQGLTAGQQKKNTQAFQRMIDLAHQRGIRFTVGIWSHIFNENTFDDSRKLVTGKKGAETSAPYLISGVTSKNLTAYTEKAIDKFLKVFPGIDGIQFRMHPESGLKPEEMPVFWHKVFQVIVKEKPKLQIDIRAKGLTDDIIDDGLSMGLKVRINTKFWMEQMGMPFHPTAVQPDKEYRRHSYSDLLSYPKKYEVNWTSWSGGTMKILLWGNPEYARRYAQSAKIYGGNSFEQNEPLATKMMRYTIKGIPHEQKPFDLLGPAYRYYDYEFERYWYFFDVSGRMAYNTQAPEDLWNAEFKHRFGPVAGAEVRKSLHQASQILPRIVASTYNYTYFPTSVGWAETMPFGNLKIFSKSGGTDIMQFTSLADEARNIINGVDDARVPVTETSKWYAAMADSILSSVKIAEKATGIMQKKEFVSTVTDLKILAHLAQYYSHRIIAGVQYNLFVQTKNLKALDDAIANEEKAVASWKDIIATAGDIYSKELLFGGMGGHWEKMLKELTEDKSLYEARAALLQAPGEQQIKINHIPVRHLMPGEKLVISAGIHSDGVKQVRCAIKTGDGDFHFVEMSPDGKWQYAVKADIPAGATKVSYYIEATDANGNKSDNSKEPVSVVVTNDTIPPVATVSRAESAPVGKPLLVTAKVDDPSGVKWVRLRYRHVNQEEIFQSIDMKLDETKGIYTAEIPAAYMISKWDMMYFIETMDKAGNGRIYPDFNKEAPYVSVNLIR
jgi:hypothetical protein